MSNFKRRYGVLVAILFSACSLSLSAQTPSPDQIEAFKKLPKSQQEMIARQYGIDPAVLSGAGGASSSQQIEEAPVVVPLKKSTGGDDKVIEEEAKKTVSEQKNRVAEQRSLPSDGLELFGYGLFAGVPTTFAPATDVPVPATYVVGPGDTIKLHMYGKINNQYELAVDRDGKITIPEIGPVYVAGVNFGELQKLIAEELKQRAIGLNVITTMGALRSIRVFILGEANTPGSYTVSALSSITNALFVSGGVSRQGSLRNIQLKRDGKIVKHFDLYDLLINGDTSNDERLLPGDVIFVPPIGHTVGVNGAVKRKAIFELKSEKTIGDVLNLAGGYLPTAHLESSKINRISNEGVRTVLDVDLANPSAFNKSVRNGDVIQVFSILDDLEDVVTLAGHVNRPGVYAYKPGLTVADLIKSVTSLLPNADLSYSLIKREHPVTREISFHQFSLRSAFSGEGVNFRLKKRDTIYIFSNEGDRASILGGDITQLYQQAGINRPPKIVSVTGKVEMPGTYPFTEGMTVGELLVAGHNPDIEADLSYAVLKRVTKYRNLETYTISLEKPSGLSMRLKEEDELFVFARNEDRAKALQPLMQALAAQTTKAIDDVQVTIDGEVRFPGKYPFSVGMTVADLIAAGGGLSESAFLGETELLRTYTDEMFDIERKSIQFHLATELGERKFQLQAKDVLNVRRIPDWKEQQFVELHGEFKFPGRYPISNGETLKDLIARIGGVTDDAFIGGAVFLRDSVAKQQAAQLSRLKSQIDKQMKIALAVKAGNSNGALTSAAELKQLSGVVETIDEEGFGRVSIDFERQLTGESSPVVLEGGDKIYLPTTPSTIVVVGEVQMLSAHTYDHGTSINEYIDLSGGVTRFADPDSIYIVRANGRVVKPSGWMSKDPDIRRGDTIVVPLDATLRDNLTLWQQVTQIMYNTAVAVAAISSL